MTAGRTVIANVRIQRRHEHQALVQQGIDTLAIRLNANDAILLERQARVAQQSSRMEQVANQHRLKYIQLRN